MEDLTSVRRALICLTTLALLAAFSIGRDLVLPVALGCLIALTLSPVTRALVRIGVPYAASASLLVLTTAATGLRIVLASAGTVALWGIPGALVAVPLLVVFKVICENVPKLEVVGRFLSADGAEDGEAAPPQRPKAQSS